VNIEQITPLASSLVQLGAETAVVARFAKALQLAPLNRDHAIPPFELRATHSTSPRMYCAQHGPEKRAAVTVAGVLQVVPLKIATCKLPLVAVAAQITLPPPSLAQLGFQS